MTLLSPVALATASAFAVFLATRRRLVSGARSPLAVTGAVAVSTHAGGRHRRAAGLVALALATAALAGPAAVGLVLVAAFARARARPLRQKRRALDEAWSSAPDVVSLLHLAVTSGLTPYLAVLEVSPLVPRPFTDAFATLATDLRSGRRLGDALQRLIDDHGEPVRPLVAALTASDRYGVPVVPALDAAAAELRRRRRQAADARARRLPVLLSFPLVCCILPAFVCLSIAPVAVSALRSLRTPASATTPTPSHGSPSAPTSPGGPP